MKKNWFVLVMSAVSSVVMYLVTVLLLNLVVRLLSYSSSDGSPQTIVRFKSMYMTVTYVFCILNVLLGLWGTFKKAGCTALMVFAVFLLLFGGVLLYLIPGVMDLIVAGKGKKKYITYKAEQDALAKLKAEQTNSVNAEEKV